MIRNNNAQFETCPGNPLSRGPQSIKGGGREYEKGHDTPQYRGAAGIGPGNGPARRLRRFRQKVDIAGKRS
jgi:hypothetical protein